MGTDEIPEFLTAVWQAPQWLVGGVALDRRETVGSLLPACFDDYVRLLHPAWLVAPDAEEGNVRIAGGVSAKAVSWAEVANSNKKELEADTQWHAICGKTITGDEVATERGGRGQKWTYPPDEGVMIGPTLVVPLFELLAGQTTSTMPCFCAFWEGHQTAWHGGPLALAGTRYRLFRGPFRDIAKWLTQRDPGLGEAGDTPDMLWPANRQWFLATPFERRSTYVGGAGDLTAAIREDNRLESFSVSRGTRLW